MGREEVLVETMIPTIEETVARMKREILEEMDAGRIPRTVSSFSELHDYIDANELGGFCESAIFDALWVACGGLPDQSDEYGMPEEMMDYINECQSAIDLWLAK